MLEARRLSKHYGDTRALDSLDLTVAGGEIVALLGANGAGKTTTMYLFLGFIAPTSGEARIDGRVVADEPEATKAHLAYVPERLALYGNLTGLENLAYFHRVGGGTLDTRALRACLADAGLAEAAVDRYVRTYSKGMRQKVGLALALAKSARSYLLDEPLSGLDPRAASEFCDGLRRLRDQGAAILMATHDLLRARDTADRIGIMRDGRLMDLVRAADIDSAALESLYLERMQ
jgi:ABC-2 type transport system ATP-binding protein